LAEQQDECKYSIEKHENSLPKQERQLQDLLKEIKKQKDQKEKADYESFENQETKDKRSKYIERMTNYLSKSCIAYKEVDTEFNK